MKKGLGKKVLSGLLSIVLGITAFSVGGIGVLAETDNTAVILKSGDGEKAGGTTTNKAQPFKGVGGSVYRIPGIITLQDGGVFICSDMRYQSWMDGGGSDIIVTISRDGGNTWNYQFPLYFADTTDSGSYNAATFVDPICLQGNDGTIYLVSNACPTAILSGNGNGEGFYSFCQGRGYVNIDGVERLVLAESWEDAFTKPSLDDGTVYKYYVGDFTENGYAPVLNRADSSPTAWVVDDMFNIYRIDGDEYLQLTQEQYTANEHNGTLVQQNVFFRDSILHVYNTQYTWMAKSKDNGVTWSHEIIENIKEDDDNATLNGCGHGIIADNGYLILPIYVQRPDNIYATFIYSKDDGETWQKADNYILPLTGSSYTGESEIVCLPDGTLRSFFRSDGPANQKIMYCDAVWDEEKQNYVFGKAVLTDVTANNSTKMTAIRYSKKIDGATAIMVSYPADTSMRADGKIWTFLLRENNEMELAYVWDCPHYWEPTSYGYSNMTELPDGSIGIIYESTNNYETPTIQELCPGAIVGDDTTKSYPPYADKQNGATLNRDTTVNLRVEENTTVYYTTDGSDPTTESEVYTNGIRFNNSSNESIEITLKAMAVTEGKEPSRIVEYTYIVSKSNSVVVDFEDNSKYTLTLSGSTGEVANGKFTYQVKSGWQATVNFTADTTFSTGANSAFAIHVSVPANAPANNLFVPIVIERNNIGYLPTPGAVAYLIPDTATEATQITVAGQAATHWSGRSTTLPAGFSGYVVIPTTSMSQYSNAFANTVDSNGKLDLENVNKVTLSHGASVQNNVLYTVDNITLVYDKDGFIKDNLDKLLTLTPGIESGSTVKNGANLTLKANENAAVIHYTLDGSEPTAESIVYKDGIVLKNDTNKPKTVTVKAIVTLKNNPDSVVYTLSYIVAADNSVILDFENAADYTVKAESATSGEVNVVNGELNYRTNTGWSVIADFAPDTSFIQGENSGLAFHITIPNTAPANNWYIINLRETNRAGYLVKNGAPAYFVSDGMEGVTPVQLYGNETYWASHSMLLSPGMSGYIVIPASSMINVKSSVINGIDDNGKLDLNTVDRIVFSSGSSAQNSTIYKVDNFTLVSDVDAFVESKAYMPLYETIDNYDTTGNTDGEFLKANTKTLVKNNETYLYSGEPLMKIAKYKTEKSALVFWVSVPEETNDTTFKLAINHNGGERYTIGAGKEYYTVTADANRNVSTYTANASQVISFEAGFKGWVVVPYTSFEAMAGWEAATTATLDFSNIRNILFYTLTGGCDMVFDQVGFTGDMSRFMTYAPVSLACDVNGDCEVDIRDIIAVKMMLAENAEPNHNPYNADLDGNGTVDVKDVIKMKRRFLGTEK